MDAKEIFLFYGDEKYLIETEVNKIKKQFGEKVKGINYISIDENSIGSLISDLETPAFGYEKKLIIARNTGIFKKTNKELAEKIADFINENEESIKESIILVFVEEEVEKNSLFKTIEKNGSITQFSKLKPIEAEKKIKAICNAYHVNIDGSTLKYFIEVCGTDMQNLINEIRKQIEFAKTNGTITKKSIDDLAIKQMDVVIYDLTDNLGKKDTKRSLEILDNMLYAKEPIQKILITLYNHFKKLYLTKIAIEENRNIAETLELRPNQMFLINKYSYQCKYFKKEELRQILQSMIDLDSNYKKRYD